MMKSDSDTSLNEPSFVVNNYRKFSTVSDSVWCTLHSLLYIVTTFVW